MNTNDKARLEKAIYALSGLTLFRSLRADALVKDVYSFLLYFSKTIEKSSPTLSERKKLIDSYARLYAKLQKKTNTHTPELTAHIKNLLFLSDNPFSRAAAKRDSTKESLDSVLWKKAQTEMENLFSFLFLPSEIFTREIFEITGQTLPDWLIPASSETPEEALSHLFSFYQKNGFGLFSLYHAFVWKNKKLEPVRNPDTIKRSQLFSYEYQLSRIDENTQKLVHGKIAENLLLFGARGTGKSSSVKAMANTYRKEGLRLIEINKDDLLTISELLENISQYLDTRFSFILYLDDLSFAENDTRYTALKTLLEGGMKMRPKNTVIYATSNRRHIIVEKKEEDMYASDSRNERLSLSDRFGISIRFDTPIQTEYLDIVRGILSERGVFFSPDTMEEEARAWAMQENGFSPRTARQFCDAFESRS